MEENKDFPNLWHALLVLLILLGIQLVISAIVYDFGAQLLAGDPRYGGVITILSCGIIFSVLMSYKKITYKQLFSPSSNLTKPLMFTTLVAITITLSGGVFLLSDLDTFIINRFSISQSDIAMFERLLGGGAISIITVCIIAPIIEEMLFRGIFLRSFMCNYSTFNAITLSALLFALSHLNIYQMIPAYILGTFLGWLYASTQSLWPSIFAHSIFNVMSMMLYYYYGGYEKSLEASYHHPVNILISVVFIMLGIKFIHTVSKKIIQANADN